MDCYRDMEDVEAAFLEFMDRMPFYGATTVCVDDPRLRALLPRVRRRVWTYGESDDAQFRLRRLAADRGGDARARFMVEADGEGEIGPFSLHVPGRHNVLNATAAVSVGVQLGVPPEQIAAGLKSFRGVDRRFQTRGVARGVTVVDDYGHHPTEVVATLDAGSRVPGQHRREALCALSAQPLHPHAGPGRGVCRSFRRGRPRGDA